MSFNRTYQITGLRRMGIEFNTMYGLPTPHSPIINHETDRRLLKFEEMMLSELEEIGEVIEESNPVQKAVKLADLLGDLIVYCVTEAVRHGVEIDAVLEAIEASNKTKLGDDGKPIVVEGKVQKGPNYQPPEGMIEEIIRDSSFRDIVRAGDQ